MLDNEVSSAMTDVIRDKYKMEMELVPPGCHRRNATEVAIRNVKAHFLSVLAGVADDFPNIMGPPPPTNRDPSQFASMLQREIGRASCKS